MFLSCSKKYERYKSLKRGKKNKQTFATKFAMCLFSLRPYYIFIHSDISYHGYCGNAFVSKVLLFVFNPLFSQFLFLFLASCINETIGCA